MTISNIVRTPWGVADHETILAEGIVFYGTPSHGGFWLDPECNAKIHPALRVQDGWYEEDCDWAKVAFSFPQYFSATDCARALQTLKNWDPDGYEAVTGIILMPGESYRKDRRSAKAGGWPE